MTRNFPRVRSLLAGLALSLIVLALLVATLEAILRTTHWLGAYLSWARPDEIIGWRFLGNVPYWYNSRENDHPITGRTNRSGWNDGEWGARKSPGVFRVAVLGDSYVEALQVERDRNFLSLAQAILNRGGKMHFELLNFGRSGFTQTEEWLVLTREVANFAPDLVALFYYAPNDIADVDPGTATDRLRPFPVAVTKDGVVLDTSFSRQRAFRLKSLVSPLKNRSALISLVAERVRFAQALRASGRDPAHVVPTLSAAGVPTIGGYLSLATAIPDPQYERSYAMTKALIGAMVRFCAKRRIRFVLIAIDTPDYLPRVEQRLKAADPTFRFGFFDRDLAAFAAAAGVGFLGLDGAFRSRYLERGAELHFAKGRGIEPPILGNVGHTGHWNYAGHSLVAELLAEKLRGESTSKVGNPLTKRQLFGTSARLQR